MWQLQALRVKTNILSCTLGVSPAPVFAAGFLPAAQKSEYQEISGVRYQKKEEYYVEFTGWDGYWQKLPVLAASKEVPDVLQMDAAYIEQYVDNGTLADLSPYIDLAEFVGEDEKQNYLIDGKLYGIPLSRNAEKRMDLGGDDRLGP